VKDEENEDDVYSEEVQVTRKDNNRREQDLNSDQT
jgi:hypothetical protein